MAQLALPLDLPESSPFRPELRPRSAGRAAESRPLPQLDGAAAQRQLDLFANPQRHYLRAVRCLEALDTTGCRAALATHRETCPDGPAPRPVAEAAVWLDLQLTVPEQAPDRYGERCLAVCRLLREGDSLPPLLVGCPGLRTSCAASVARRAVAWARQEGLPAQTCIALDLPWAALNLVAGDPAGARHGLLVFLTEAPASAGAWLALAEACEELGKGQEAVCALREGHGLDPGGGTWGPACGLATRLRRSFQGDALFDGDWWLAGAYLDGELPRYVRSDPVRVAERHRRFAALCQTGAPAPVRFFAGLFLSEQAELLPHPQLVAVRRVLRDLHAEAFQLHMERQEELGPPAAGGGGLAG